MRLARTEADKVYASLSYQSRAGPEMTHPLMCGIACADLCGTHFLLLTGGYARPPG